MWILYTVVGDVVMSRGRTRAQALLHDLHVQHAQEAAAEAEAQGLEVSGSKKKDASLRRSFSSASRRAS
jgi:hypothetical protein